MPGVRIHKMRHYMGFCVDDATKEFFGEFQYGNRSSMLRDIVKRFKERSDLTAMLDRFAEDYKEGQYDQYELFNIYLTMQNIITELENDGVIGRIKSSMLEID